MRLLAALACLPLGAQAPAPNPVADPDAPDLSGEVQRELEFEGTPREAMDALVGLSEDGEHQRAVAIAQQMAGDASLAEPLRAEFHFAAGVCLHAAGAPLDAASAFGSARALAGPGELRDDATYDLGTTRLELAEEQLARAKQPPGGPQRPPGPPSASGGAPPTEEVDWLAVAERSYLRAKESLVERLRSDWRDPDTRANLELIQRRLREIEEMRRQQEEEQQGEGDPEQQDGEQGEGDPQDGTPRNPEEAQQPDQQPQGGDAADGATQELDPSSPQTPDELPEPQDEAGAGGEETNAERRLSREEVLRLLETLDELDQEARQIEALLRQSRHVPVEKDW